MYISEIAPLNLRGGLGTVNQLAVTVGLLTGQVLGVDYLLGTDEGWPYLLGIAVFPSILQLLLLPICPESPRYLLITKGRRIEVSGERILTDSTNQDKSTRPERRSRD